MDETRYPPSNLNLMNPSTPEELRVAAAATKYWDWLLEEKIFQPNRENAKWINIPFRAKVHAFFEAQRRLIP